MELLGSHERDVDLLKRAAVLYENIAWPAGQVSCLRRVAEVLEAGDEEESFRAYVSALSVKGGTQADLVRCHSRLAVLGSRLTNAPGNQARIQTAKDSIEWLSKLGPLPDDVCGACAFLLGVESAQRLCPQLKERTPVDSVYREGLELAQRSVVMPWGRDRDTALSRVAEMLGRGGAGGVDPSWRSLYVAGLALCHLGKIRAALPVLYDAVHLSSMNSAPAMVLALAVSRLEPRMADKLVDAVLLRDPRCVQAHALRCALHPTAAEQWWASYVAAKPAKAWVQLSRIQTQPDQRLLCALKALNADPLDVDAMVCHAAASGSVPSLQTLLLKHPTHSWARIELAQLFLGQQDIHAATAQLWTCIRTHARCIEAWRLLGQVILQGNGDPAHAVKCFTIALHLEAVEPPLPWPVPSHIPIGN